MRRFLLSRRSVGTGLAALAAVSAALGAASAPAPPRALLPVNDECATAIPAFDGANAPGTNLGSTTSAPAWPCAAGGSDVWYSYVATCTGTTTFGMCCPGSADYDTALEVFDGSGGCGGLVSLGCDDDTCAVSSSLTVPTTAGTTYYARVGGFAGSTGTFVLGITPSCAPPPPLPANNECATAIPAVTGLNPPATSCFATTSAPPFACGAGGSDVWYSYLATCTGMARFSFCPPGSAAYDSVIAVYSGPCGGLALLGCNDDTCGLSSEVVVPVVAGTTYRVRVGGFAGAAAGPFALYIGNTPGSGSFSTTPTGCGATTITASGSPTLGASVTYTLGGLVGVPLIWVGGPILFPLCPPAPCALGATLGIVLATPTASGTIPCDPTLVGGSFYVQRADVLAPGGCGVVPAGVPLTVTDTVTTTIG
ncbi:MAG TPA: hypothetical protein VFI25_00860 [Planctomycetota bacterium]|nr:hypothetical protein [Planctomycetota bacterium]